MSSKNENALRIAIANLLEKTNADEIKTTLGLMMETYIVYAPVSRDDLANTASLTLLLTNFFTEIEPFPQPVKVETDETTA